MNMSIWDLDGMTVAELKEMLSSYSDDAVIDVFSEYEHLIGGGEFKDRFKIIEKE